jgi:hypothetical protein
VQSATGLRVMLFMMILTGVAVGLFDPLPAAIEQLIRLRAGLEPDLQTHVVYNELFEIYQEADKNLAGIAHQLTEFERES